MNKYGCKPIKLKSRGRISTKEVPCHQGMNHRLHLTTSYCGAKTLIEETEARV